jgi:DNA-binding MurR/RpiR family transcriptional regulator
MQKKVQDLKQRIKDRIPHLTESQKIVANFIVENPQNFALSSIRELEKELKTSKATIVRLAQRLGYNGFHELKSAFLKRMRTELDPLHRYKEFLSQSSEHWDYLELMAEETNQNIEATMHILDRMQLEKAVHLLESAGHVYTIGLGISTYLAEISTYLLNRVSIRSHCMVHSGLTFTEQIINLSEDDTILAFSFPEYSSETIEAACYAKERNVKVIAFTDKLTSEIVQYCDVYLQVVVESKAVSNSIMPVLVILYSMVTQIGGERKRQTLEFIESFVHVRKEHSGKNPKI